MSQPPPFQHQHYQQQPQPGPFVHPQQPGYGVQQHNAMVAAGNAPPPPPPPPHHQQHQYQQQHHSSGGHQHPHMISPPMSAATPPPHSAHSNINNNSSSHASCDNVLVANLPKGTDDVALRNMFAHVGSIVSAKVMVDIPTGKLKGFGFVRFTTPEEASRAVETMNRVIPMNVREIEACATASSNSSAASGSAAALPAPQPLHVALSTHGETRRREEESCTLYVANLPVDITDEQLRPVFNGPARVVDVTIPSQQRSGSQQQQTTNGGAATAARRCIGIALVRYHTIEDARRAMEALQNTTPFNELQALQIRFKDTKAPNGGGGGVAGMPSFATPGGGDVGNSSFRGSSRGGSRASVSSDRDGGSRRPSSTSSSPRDFNSSGHAGFAGDPNVVAAATATAYMPAPTPPYVTPSSGSILPPPLPSHQQIILPHHPISQQHQPFPAVSPGPQLLIPVAAPAPYAVPHPQQPPVQQSIYLHQQQQQQHHMVTAQQGGPVPPPPNNNGQQQQGIMLPSYGSTIGAPPPPQIPVGAPIAFPALHDIVIFNVPADINVIAQLLPNWAPPVRMVAQMDPNSLAGAGSGIVMAICVRLADTAWHTQVATHINTKNLASQHGRVSCCLLSGGPK